MYTRLPETTLAQIHLIFLAINVLKVAGEALESIFMRLFGAYRSLDVFLDRQFGEYLRRLGSEWRQAAAEVIQIRVSPLTF